MQISHFIPSLSLCVCFFSVTFQLEVQGILADPQDVAMDRFKTNSFIFKEA